MMHNALYQSAWISTGLPRRGVTTQSPTLASIQVSWTPGSPEEKQAARIHLDSVTGAANVPQDDVSKHRVELVADELQVARVSKVGASRFEKPQRGIDSVVLGSFAGIGKTVGQHALICMLGKGPQDATRNFVLASRQR